MNRFFALLIVFTTFFTMNSQTNNSNCQCCTEKHAEFDFWLGSWEVTNPNGSAAGANTIVKDQDGCMLRENWISATPGFTGTSSNFYNVAEKRWEQIWIDNQGGTLHLKGNRKGNQMILQTDELTNSEGAKYFYRITWTANKDGTVRQYWETITNGKDVTVAFDGLYKKIKESP